MPSQPSKRRRVKGPGSNCFLENLVWRNIRAWPLSYSFRTFEITPSGVLHFDGVDITAGLPFAMVLTLAANPYGPDVFYAGIQGEGVLRGVRDANDQWSR